MKFRYLLSLLSNRRISAEHPPEIMKSWSTAFLQMSALELLSARLATTGHVEVAGFGNGLAIIDRAEDKGKSLAFDKKSCECVAADFTLQLSATGEKKGTQESLIAFPLRFDSILLLRSLQSHISLFLSHLTYLSTSRTLTTSNLLQLRRSRIQTLKRLHPFQMK